MEDFLSVEVGEELTVSSSQSKKCDLSCSVQLLDAILLFQCLSTSGFISSFRVKLSAHNISKSSHLDQNEMWYVVETCRSGKPHIIICSLGFYRIEIILLW